MEAPRLTAVVVLPTPPFWFATARTLPIQVFKLRGGAVGSASVVGSVPNGVVLPAFTAAMKGGSAWLVGGSIRNGDIAAALYGTPSLLVVRVRATQRPLRRHPGPPRKPLGRRRILAEHVQMAIAGPRKRLDRKHVIEGHPHLGRRPPPQP